MIIDIHTHTYPGSDDSFLTPEQLVAEAKRLGLDGVCITEHDGFWAAEDIDRLSRTFDFPIFPGCEVTTEDGHLLVYGLRKYIFGMHRSSFVKRLVDEAGGAIVVAHPYRRTFRPDESETPEGYDRMLDRACRNDAFSLSDAVEVLNGRGSERENDDSLVVAPTPNGDLTQSAYIVVEEIEGYYERVKAAGANIVMELEEQSYGGSNFAVRDPEGQLWNVGSYDPWAEHEGD